jgi:hypothetical protein
MFHVLAYIDPGSGSLIIQAAIAALVAAPIVFRRQLTRVTQTLRQLGRRPASTPHGDDVSRAN